MGKNEDKAKNFARGLQVRGHLEKMVNARGNYHIPRPELNRMGVGVKEAANLLIAITGDKRSVVINDDGVSIKNVAQKVCSYCYREGIDMYQPSTELTEPVIEQPSDELTY